MDATHIRLTELSSCAGCAAKLGATELAQALRGVTPATNERVLVGYGTSDDAGVFLIRDDLALVQTVDFFTPIVDDPFDFGRIAAANALSDIYAMGGRALTALNIVAFPEALDLTILTRILEGGSTVARAAGVAILGGHSIKDDEPKYGMAVTGEVDPKRIVTNAGARPGDILILTKPIGTGILTTAAKNRLISYSELREAIDWMTTLNDRGSQAMIAHGAHAATDITGFGLIGHANGMARASNVCITIDAASVPFMTRVHDLIAEGVAPGGTRNNLATHASYTTYASHIGDTERLALSDAQTSGGLLIAISPANADALRADLREAGLCDAIVGTVSAGSGIIVA